MTKPFGFCIVRNVQSSISNEYWKECYRCIRVLYSDPILIFDTGSKTDLVEFMDTIPLDNATIQYSEKPNKALFGAYMYLLKHKPFEKVVVLHDSVFLKKKLPFETVSTVKFLWHFQHPYDNPVFEIPLLTHLNDTNTLVQMYDLKELWKGCFGSMCVLTWDFLNSLETIHGFSGLDAGIQSWDHWLAFERIFALLCTIEEPGLIQEPSLLGDIHKYTLPIGFQYESYKQKMYSQSLAAIKVWSTRK
jgi:hypothetical protein